MTDEQIVVEGALSEQPEKPRPKFAAGGAYRGHRGERIG